MQYTVYGFVARAATLRRAATGIAEAQVVPLKFGLAFVPATDALAERLRGSEAPSEPPFIEFVHLSVAEAAWGEEASLLGPVAYVEAEYADGAGWHAAVLWRGGRREMGPLHAEGRGPVCRVLAALGVARRGGDEWETLGLTDFRNF